MGTDSHCLEDGVEFVAGCSADGGGGVLDEEAGEVAIFRVVLYGE